jgi:hypothetical protein
MIFEKEKFTAKVRFTETIYNKETYTELAENFMEDCSEDTYARMTWDNVLSAGFVGFARINCNIKKIKHFLDLIESIKVTSIKQVEDTDDKNKKVFELEFEFESIPFTEETYILEFPAKMTWEDVKKIPRYHFASDDIRGFFGYAMMQ